MHQGTFARAQRTAVIAAAAVLLAGCSTAGTSPAPVSGTVEVVTSTDVYGDIVHAIGGDKVHVTPIIHTTAQDPHSYQATTQDKLTVSKARLLVENGGGYDDFFRTLAADTTGDHQLIDVTDLSGLSTQSPTAGTDFNEHLWYNFDTMGAFADTVSKNLAGVDPADTATYTANTDRFKADLGKLKDRAAAVKAHHTGEAVAITEPVPLYLLQAAGLVNKTPAEYSHAIEAGQDVPAAVMKDTLDLISTRSVKFLAYNNQTEGPQTTALKDAATSAGVPVIDFTETLPADQTYLQWMNANVDHIDKALQG
ncbi:zinc ABC transporter substrate-binding protein [Arthrobacter sp. C9C5]|uniref:metal ABC transporter solute-binding protein, Zn/Mn family n=1 Tax=Arthrobacter sp. C9C5 TaxID=2735267 RepID=UPI001585C635|nr:zinc ABC transporter substrate-binding protein [Arthrobacter sp. C9C5]NUU33393.1 zinc ABC transporter solute-binding protein [Arthrobacter sp. C9C5]